MSTVCTNPHGSAMVSTNAVDPGFALMVDAANEPYYESPADAHLSPEARRMIDAMAAAQSESKSPHVPNRNLLSSNMLVQFTGKDRHSLPINDPVFETLNKRDIGLQSVAHASPDTNVVYGRFGGNGGRGFGMAQPEIVYQDHHPTLGLG